MDGSFESVNVSLERNYRDRIQAISEDFPFLEDALKRIKIIILDENNAKLVVKYKVFEDFFNALKLSETYGIPDIVFDESFF